MAIKVGDRVPNGSFTVMTADGPKPKTSDELFKGKKVVLFAVPGAFTPTCSNNHLPGFVKNAAAIKAKGIDTIAVTGVNDVFVMNAWKKASGSDDIEFLALGHGRAHVDKDGLVVEQSVQCVYVALRHPIPLQLREFQQFLFCSHNGGDLSWLSECWCRDG